jgi:2OG-Fe(II) oxygenase superfamily
MSVSTTDILNPDLRSRAAGLAEEYRNAEPYPHVVISDFFSPEFCRRLLDEFPAFDEEFARNEAGNVGRKAARSKVRDLSAAYREVDDLIQTTEFLELISDITGIPNLLYDPEYFGGGTHENLNGQGLDPHVDFNYHPTQVWHRRLNLIVYLNPEWELDWGGNFDLHSDPWLLEGDQVKSILPVLNRCVIFETSERSWHGFSPIELPEGRKDLSRKSFAIYLYTKERPPEETAASHATVYVPRAVPDDVLPGEVLTQRQYNQLVAHFIHHRGIMRRLYRRELRFNSEMEALRERVAELREALDKASQD